MSPRLSPRAFQADLYHILPLVAPFLDDEDRSVLPTLAKSFSPTPWPPRYQLAIPPWRRRLRRTVRDNLDEIIDSGAEGWEQGSYAGYLLGFYLVATSLMPEVLGHRVKDLFMNAIFFGFILSVIPLAFVIVLGLPKRFSYVLVVPFFLLGLSIGVVPCIKYFFHCVMPLLPKPGDICELEFSDKELGMSAFLLLWLFPTCILWLASIPNNRVAPDAMINLLDIGLRQRNAVGESLEGLGRGGHHFIGSVREEIDSCFFLRRFRFEFATLPIVWGVLYFVRCVGGSGVCADRKNAFDPPAYGLAEPS